MQVRKHVHAHAPDTWPRCSEVEIENGLLGYKLAKGRAYDLVEAYADEPHVKFANCESDADFRRFVLRFGPLLLPEQNPILGWGVVPLRDYQAASRFLRSVMRMMVACKKSQGHREALVEFFAALTNNPTPGPKRDVFNQAVSLDVISPLSGFRTNIGDPVEWAKHASATDVRKALASCVEDWFRSPNRWGFRVQAIGRGFEIKPSFELHSLWDGLRWMLFFDEWNKRPPVLCQECPKIFRPGTAHDRKYCSPECAHRAANRIWRRKDLQKKRTNRKRIGGTNVTHKTR